MNKSLLNTPIDEIPERLYYLRVNQVTLKSHLERCKLILLARERQLCKRQGSSTWQGKNEAERSANRDETMQGDYILRVVFKMQRSTEKAIALTDADIRYLEDRRRALEFNALEIQKRIELLKHGILAI